MDNQEFRELRQNYGSQVQFAERTGLSISLIKKIETGKRKVSEYTRLRLKDKGVI